MGTAHGAYRADDLAVRPAGDTTAALCRRPGRARRHRPAPRGLTWHRQRTGRDRGRGRPRTAGVRRSRTGSFGPGRTARSPGSTTAPSCRTRFPPARPPSCGTCSALRDTARALLDAEAASPRTRPRSASCGPSWTAATTLTCAAYGPLNRFTLRRTGRTDPVTGEPVMARIQPPQGGFRGRPVRAAGLRAGGVRPGRPAGRQGGDLPRTGHRPAGPAARRGHPGRRAGDLPGHLRRGAAGRDRPAARHRPRTRPAPSSARWSSTTRSPGGWSRRPSTCPGTSAHKLRAAEQAADGRSPVRGQRRRAAPGYAARPDAGRDRRPARRGLDRRRLRRAVPAGDPR